MASTTGAETDRVQAWARPFVALLLAGFLTCGIFGIEAWPLTGFRLFSAPRSTLSTGWRLVAVTTDGAEVAINVSRFGEAYRGFGFVARTIDDLTAAERAAVCATWIRAAASIGIDAAALMVVRFEQALVPRDHDGPLAEPRRTVAATCAGNST